MTLVARYKLDRDTKDTGPNGYHGTNNGVTFVPGQVNNAGDFELDDTDSISLPALKSFSVISIALWFKMEQIGVLNHYLIDLFNDTSNRILFLITPGSDLTLLITTPDGTASLTTTGSLLVDTWYQAIITYDGNTVKYYLDNVELTPSDSLTGNLDLSTTGIVGFRIGARGNNLFHMDGLIDDIEIHDAVLTDLERERLFNRSGRFEVEINGIDYSPELINYSMEREFGISNIMTVNLADENGTIRNILKPRINIDIYYQGTHEMIGFVEDRPKVLQTGFLSIIGKGYVNRLFEKTITVEEPSILISDFIISVIATFYPTEFTTNNVSATAITYDELSFVGQKPWNVFRELVKREDFQIYIDEDKDINLMPLFSRDTGRTYDYDTPSLSYAGMFDPEFPDNASSIFNSVVVRGKMTDADGGGGATARYTNFDSVDEYGERIEHNPITFNEVEDEEEAYQRGQAFIDELAFALQVGAFWTEFDPTLDEGMLIRVTYASRNLSSSQFIVRKVKHSMKPFRTYIDVAQVKSTTLDILRSTLNTIQVNEERFKDASSIVGDYTSFNLYPGFQVNTVIEKQNVGGRQWNQVPWNTTSWLAGAGTWTEVVAELSLQLSDAGRKKILDLLTGVDTDLWNATYMFIAFGIGTTPPTTGDTALETESDVYDGVGNRMTMDAGFPKRLTDYKLAMQGSISDSFISSATYYEVGLFDQQSPAGDMYGRAVIAVGFLKAPNENLRARVTIEVLEV